MLSDYRAYLLNIRNSLIKCGVDLEVKDISSYDEVFYLGEMLSDLLWFYSVLSIGGSDDRLRGFLFPLNHISNKEYETNNTEELEGDEFISYVVLEDDCSNELEEANDTNELEDVTTEELEDNEYTYIEGNIIKKDAGYLVIPQKGEEFGDDDYFIEYSIESTSEVVDIDIENISEIIDEVTPRKGEEFGDGDYFIEYGIDDIVEEDNNDEDEEEYEDEFSNWGSSDEDLDSNPIEEECDEENEFSSWGNNDEDEFSNWGSTEEYVEEGNEDTYGNWGSTDEDEENEFPNWGSDVEDEDTYDNWGSDDEDTFSSWSSSDENDEDEYDEDTFGSWGSSDESSIDSEDLDRSDFGSWGQSQYSSNTISNTTPNEGMSSEMKSKLDYEIESNEKTAMIIEKIASGIFSKGNIFKTKVSEKIKNLGDTQE